MNMDPIYEREGSELGIVVAIHHMGIEVHPDFGECFIVKFRDKLPFHHPKGFYIPDRDILLYPTETHISESQYRQEKQLMDNDSNEFVNTTNLLSGCGHCGDPAADGLCDLCEYGFEAIRGDYGDLTEGEEHTLTLALELRRKAFGYQGDEAVVTIHAEANTEEHEFLVQCMMPTAQEDWAFAICPNCHYQNRYCQCGREDN